MNEAVDVEIQNALSESDPNRAATLLLETYGQELRSYLTGTMHDPYQAQEVFAAVAEDLWRGLPTFEWRSTVRSWAYAVTRNRRARYLRDQQRGLRLSPVSSPSALSVPVELTRTNTPLHLRSEVKARMRRLRESLSEPEQTLLILRVDRNLSWSELVVVLEGPTDDADELSRASARLRQRFQKLKAKLRRLAIEAQLLERDA